jgi:hypothetical protein
MKRPLLAAAALITVISGANATADGCAIVTRTPDGFLNLRELPTAPSAVVMRLLPGELLNIDDAGCEKKGNLEICQDDPLWTHVTGVPRLERKDRPLLRGWVSARYIKTVECED